MKTKFRRSIVLTFFVFFGFCFVGLPNNTIGQESKADTKIARWNAIELSFKGPETSESAETNPFTDTRLLVTFTHAKSETVVRGFYAADGDAAETSAEAGNIWQVRFAPDLLGKWTYSATLRMGEDVAINDNPGAGIPFELQNPSGSFEVIAAEPTKFGETIDFRDRGRIIVDKGYFRIGKQGPRWLKAGADSPENLLAFVDFDGTYRTSDKARDGESAPSDSLHRFPTHVKDWRTGDPTWQAGKGKALIGAINYLSSMGMNSVYFLTNNIKGDGHDVWPYASHDDFTRFDCSKLDQWEIVFDHMQSKGILLHVVTQETENEKMLDDGDTGRLRKLYFRELIARFAHHPALVWNLGEENGPAEFSPDGQNAEQQKAMADYLKKCDPYQHPVVIHTHSTANGKEEILEPLLGHSNLDGLSFQVDDPKRVHRELLQWKHRAKQSGHSWLIAMDEIGKWDTGVLPDSKDPDHDIIRYRVLWGSLMSGAAGVEWYFGAKQKHNDLNCEDWRQHENMWKQTRHATKFFQDNLPYWEMEVADDLVDSSETYCFAKPGEVYAIYVPASIIAEQSKALKLKVPSVAARYTVKWYSPKQGGELQSGSAAEFMIEPSGNNAMEHSLGRPPNVGGAEPKSQDWVILVNRTSK